MSITFGTDPEFILSRNGQPRSAIGIVPGTKDNRHKIGKNEFYYDNVLAECTIPPAKSKDEAISFVRKVLTQFAGIVKPAVLVAQASIDYPASELKHEDAVRIGCDPEFCAYTMSEIRPPEDVMLNGTMRSTGGHIHIGCQYAKNMMGCIDLIRMMDLFVGIPSVMLDTDPTSKRRKKLYGQAGRFRKPDHGAEYRTLSDFWLRSPDLVGLIYTLTEKAVDFCDNGGVKKFWSVDEKRLSDQDAWNEPDFTVASCHHCDGYDPNEVRNAIDNVNQKSAIKLMPFVKTLLGTSLYGEVESAIEKGIPESGRLYQDWKINV